MTLSAEHRSKFVALHPLLKWDENSQTKKQNKNEGKRIPIEQHFNVSIENGGLQGLQVWKEKISEILIIEWRGGGGSYM